MIMTAAQLCELLNGELEGNRDEKIVGPSQIDKGVPGTVTFLANPKYEDFLYRTQASVVIVSKDLVLRQPVAATLIRVPDAYGAMLRLAAAFTDTNDLTPGISPLASLPPGFEAPEGVAIGPYAVIESGAHIGRGAQIYPHVYIGRQVSIGEDVVLYPGVKLYPRTVIGDRSIIHANAVLGSDGFGYRPDQDGRYHKIPHTGQVVLEEDVEIGAHVVIDRGTFGATRICRGTKIDNLVQIAHNVTIGPDSVIAAQVGIAGSTSIGGRARIGGQAGIVGHLQLPDGLEIQAQSGVTSSRHESGSRLYGSPAIEYQDYLRSYAAFKQLPDYIRRIAALEKELAALKNNTL